MSVRFPDLQVLLPRSLEAGRIEAVSLQQQVHQQQILGQEHVQRQQQRLQEVRQAAEEELRPDPDGRRDDRPQAFASKGRRRPKPSEDVDRRWASTGQRIDLRA